MLLPLVRHRGTSKLTQTNAYTYVDVHTHTKPPATIQRKTETPPPLPHTHTQADRVVKLNVTSGLIPAHDPEALMLAEALFLL